jgi:hypothetical protein
MRCGRHCVSMPDVIAANPMPLQELGCSARRLDAAAVLMDLEPVYEVRPCVCATVVQAI